MSKKIKIKKNFPTKKFWFEILTQVLSIEFKKMMNWEEVILLLQVYELLSQWKVGWFSSSLDIKYFIGSGFSQIQNENVTQKVFLNEQKNISLIIGCFGFQCFYYFFKPEFFLGKFFFILIFLDNFFETINKINSAI